MGTNDTAGGGKVGMQGINEMTNHSFHDSGDIQRFYYMTCAVLTYLCSSNISEEFIA